MHTESEEDMFEPIVRGVAQAGVRVANERAVLTLIAGIPGVSNADIARRSGLGPQTTARILADLEARDLVIRGEVLRGRRGQPATPYTLNPKGGYCFGVEIGWDHVEVLLQDISGRPLAAIRRAHRFPDPDVVFPQIAAEVGSILYGLDHSQRARLAGIGVATPGAFGPLLERLGAPAEIVEAWGQIDIAGRIALDTGLATTWSNSGSTAAWCELTMSPPPRPGGCAAFFIGTFIGGGIISGGQLLQGPRGNAADLGSIIVTDGGTRADYLHLRASIHALRQRLRAAGHPAAEAPALAWDTAELEPHMSNWLGDAARSLAQAVLSTAAITEIDLAFINGDLPAPLLARLVERTEAEMAALPTLLPRLPRLVAGVAGASAPALGAARLVLFNQYFSRAWDLFRAEAEK